MARSTGQPQSFAQDLDLSTNRATQAICEAQSALIGLTRHPELGFAIDPAALKAEVDRALDQLLLVRRMVLAAQGRPDDEPSHPDARKPVPWGEHPHGCDCGDCP